MTFLSMRKISNSSKTDKFLTIRKNRVAYISKSILAGEKTVEMQINVEKKEVRLRLGEGLRNKLCGPGGIGGQFTVPSAVIKAVIERNQIKRRIDLEKNSDGWWYGSYKSEEE
ncbi:hypothetical protein KGP26_29700 (plasmid) [Serratia sp. JSRIV002]|uniref:hypothetical protein n=1 Tax=Serratia sp. JSRIV002 TaxID=2831894 RepID=UPI001CBF7523|nr:hypothetical protein [Serratia sp. JSRIV002]UAN54726.1 hypothetical protein KGP26_29700 [Serratia sp. JSRIV002]